MRVRNAFELTPFPRTLTPSALGSLILSRGALLDLQPLLPLLLHSPLCIVMTLTRVWEKMWRSCQVRQMLLVRAALRWRLTWTSCSFWGAMAPRPLLSLLPRLPSPPLPPLA